MNNKAVAYPFLLLVIAVATHIQWMNPFSILSFADWSYWPAEGVDGLWRTWSSWVPFVDYGSANIQLSFLFFKSIWSFVVFLGGSYDLAVKITFLLPILSLGVLAPYYFVVYLTNDRFVAFCGALFYYSTTFFLIRQTSHLPIAFVYALVPLLLMYWDKAVVSSRKKYYVIFLLLYFVGTLYEIRIMYIVSFILVLHVIIVRGGHIVHSVKFLLILGLTLLLLSSFWIVPIIFGGVSQDVSAIANRGLFGNHLFSLSQALTIFESSWTGSYPNMNFEPQQIPIRFWFIPMFVIISVLFIRGWTDYRRGIFFATISFLGIFLSKQAQIPGEGVYEWLYFHFPGFNLFREASKFYMLTAVGYLGLIVYLLVYIRERKTLFFGMTTCLIILSAWNLFPLFTRSFGTLFVSRSIPSDYSILSQTINNREGYARTLWIPTYSRWAPFSADRPKIGAVNLIMSHEKTLFRDISNKQLSRRKDLQIEEWIGSPLFQLMLKAGSIRYIVVPPRDYANDDDYYRFYGGEYNDNIFSWYVDLVDNVPNLERHTSELTNSAIYENINVRPYISSSATLVKLPSYTFINEHLAFVEEYISIDADYIFSDLNPKVPTTKVSDIFETIETHDVARGSVTSKEYNVKNAALYLPKGTSVDKNDTEGGVLISTSDTIHDIPSIYDLSNTSNLTVTYSNQGISAENLIQNGSFEEGAWQQGVDDCNNYDDAGDVTMNITSNSSTNGDNSLQLSTVRHAACTHQSFAIKPNTKYLLEFDYQSIKSSVAGFYLEFDSGETIQHKLTNKTEEWDTHRRVITSPIGAQEATLFVYSYEEGRTFKRQIVNYDNFSLIELPEIINNAYIVEVPDLDLEKPASINFKSMNPAKKIVSAKGVRKPFVLTMSENYHPKWMVSLQNHKTKKMIMGWMPWSGRDAIADASHFNLNGFLNGWYVDPVELCHEDGKDSKLVDGCTINEDGSYDIEMVIEFTPQRWFYLGLLISGTTFVILVGYLGYDLMRRRRRGKSKRSNVLNPYFHGNENGGMRVDSRSKSRMTRWRSDNGDVRQLRRKNLPRRRM